MSSLAIKYVFYIQNMLHREDPMELNFEFLEIQKLNKAADRTPGTLVIKMSKI